MSNEVIVHKGRTNKVIIKMGMDVSADVFTSEIRAEPFVDSAFIAAWTVSFLNDGTDGQLVLVLDDSITSQIRANSGYMDLKRVSNGEPIPVFDRPLDVAFRGSVTE
jgi:hypothetical protein